MSYTVKPFRYFSLRGALRTPFQKRRYGPHYEFMFEGKRIIYCYIRKNASSAFKRLIVDLSTAGQKPEPDENKIHYLNRHHRIQNPQRIRGADHVIFVHRNPIDRMISLFTGKFIQHKGNRGIFKSYRNITEENPETATFSDFVDRYLQKGTEKLDPHVFSQCSHLLPAMYTEAIPLEKLYSAMKDILSPEAADIYFAQKTNSSTVGLNQYYDDSDVAITPASILRERWLMDASLPRKQCFLHDRTTIADKLKGIYWQDEALRNKLANSSR